MKAMCWSSGTPKSAAPCSTSSRLTPRANALSLSFFLTLETSRSDRLRDGRTRAQATRKPESSSTANSAFAIGVARVAQYGLLHRLGKAGRRQHSHALARVLGRRRVGVVGEPLVVEVVKQAYHAPGFGVLAGLPGHRPHGDLD